MSMSPFPPKVVKYYRKLGGCPLHLHIQSDPDGSCLLALTINYLLYSVYLLNRAKKTVPYAGV